MSDIGRVGTEADVAEEEHRKQPGREAHLGQPAANDGEEAPVATGKGEGHQRKEHNREKKAGATRGQHAEHAQEKVAVRDQDHPEAEAEACAPVREPGEKPERERQRERRNDERGGPKREHVSHCLTSREERVHEGRGSEGGEIAETFAGTDEAHR